MPWPLFCSATTIQFIFILENFQNMTVINETKEHRERRITRKSRSMSDSRVPKSMDYSSYVFQCQQFQLQLQQNLVLAFKKIYGQRHKLVLLYFLFLIQRHPLEAYVSALFIFSFFAGFMLVLYNHVTVFFLISF